VFAARAGVALNTVRDLETGSVRPSDRMTRRLAEALAFDRDPVRVALLDLRLQDAAGSSLRRWRRRRPPRVAVQRVYAEARRVLDVERAEQHQAADEFLDDLTAGLLAEPEPARPASPAEVWPERWPRVRPHQRGTG